MPTIEIPSFTGGVVEAFGEGPVTFNVKSGQTVKGGTLVEFTGDMEVQTAGGAKRACGVALFDADPSGFIKTVTVDDDGVYFLKADGNIGAGDSLIASSQGRVKKWTNESIVLVIGQAWQDIASGETGICDVDA